MLIDTHAHLNFPDFTKASLGKPDLDEVIKQSVENGVEKIICVSSSLKDSVKTIEIAQKYKGVVFAAVGIHPNQTDFQEKIPILKQLELLKKLIKEKEVVAIGECGLDFSGVSGLEKNRNQKEQIFLFEKQLELALDFDLPVLLHSRKALPQVLEILKSLKKKVSGVFHCYSGGKKDVAKIEELGLFFGLDGNLTYDIGLQNVVKNISLEKILLETDCPFLSPKPFRGLRNEPKNVKVIAKFLAQIKEKTFEEVAQISTQNAKNLLKI